MRIGPRGEDEAGEASREDAEFALQLAAILRKAEHPRADFDARVKAAVLAARPVPSAGAVLGLSQGGWRQRRYIMLTPMAWAALAAGFAAIVSLGTVAVARMGTSRMGTSRNAQQVANTAAHMRNRVQSSHDTVYVVRFVLADVGARTVTLVGDFNAWARQSTPLVSTKPGVWTAQVALPAGRHEYAFVVDGKRWVVDPAADRVADDFDTPSSVVTVGDADNIAAQ